MFNDQVPVVHATFTIEKIITDDFFMNFISSENRSQWDPIKKKIKIEGQSEKYFIRILDKNLQFEDYFLLKKSSKGIAFVSFSVESEESEEVGENFMSLVSIERSFNQTTVQGLFQIDFKLGHKKNQFQVVPNIFEKWSKNLKNFLMKEKEFSLMIG